MSTHDNLHPVAVSAHVECRFALDGGAMFGIIPRTLWEKTNPPDDRNRIAMTCRLLVVEMSNGDRCLVDVGMGDRWSDKLRSIYKLEAPDLMEQVPSLGADSITHVILTHLHFDHAGGLTRSGSNGAIEPVFPNAHHWVQAQQFAWANGPSGKDGGSYRKDDFAILGQDEVAVTFVDGPAEILPGIEVIPVNGHTFGMQLVKVTTPDDTYLFMADLVPTTSHLRDPFIMGYDVEPLVTLRERRNILWQVRQNNWTMVFDHDPITPMAKLGFDPRGNPIAIAC